MVTKSFSFLVLFLTTLGIITSIIPPLNAQENIENQAGTLQQQQRQQNQFQYNTKDFQTFTKYMDMYNELYPPQSQQQGYNNYNDFLTFMQYLQYYDNLYGQKDYIIKLYDNDDDKDNKYKYKYKYKKDFEEYKEKKHGQGDREGTKGGLWNPDNRYHPDYAGDDRKYCTDNGVWKDGKCNIEDDEERANYEDVVCDDGPSKACGNIIRDIYTEKEIEELDLLDDPRYWNDEPQRQEQKKPDYDSYEEYNEIVEPICKEHGGKINYGSGECGFDDDIDRAKSSAFEKELDDRGLGADYTAEEEASWNQNQDEVEPIEDEKIASPVFIPLEEGDGEKEADEKLAEYNRQMDEYYHGGGGGEEQIQNEENEITPEEADEINEQNEQEEEKVADNNEEDDNQVNTDTEDSSDNTDSSNSQDSSDSEDNSSDDGGDSSDSSDDSSSNDDGDGGDSSESEE